jgi:hypothetical protein
MMKRFPSCGWCCKLVPRVHRRERSPGTLRPTRSTDGLSVLTQLACASRGSCQLDHQLTNRTTLIYLTPTHKNSVVTECCLGGGLPASPPSQFVIAREINCNGDGRDPLDFQGLKSKYAFLNRFRRQLYSVIQWRQTVLIRGVPLYQT